MSLKEKAEKEKVRNILGGDKEKVPAHSDHDNAEDEREESPLVDTEMDFKDREWSPEPEEEMSEIYINESQNPTKNY